jgi:hypothetical protein
LLAAGLCLLLVFACCWSLPAAGRCRKSLKAYANLLVILTQLAFGLRQSSAIRSTFFGLFLEKTNLASQAPFDKASFETLID